METSPGRRPAFFRAFTDLCRMLTPDYISKPLSQPTIGKILVFWLWLFITALPFVVLGQDEAVLTLSQESESYNLGPYVYYYEDTDNSVGIEEITSAEFEGSFTRSAQERLNFGYTKSNFWIKFYVDNTAPASERWMLTVKYPVLDSIRLYSPSSTGGWNMLEAGDFYPVDSREFQHRYVVMDLNAKPGITPYYLWVRTEGSYQVPLRIYSLKALYESDVQVELLFGLYYGVMLVMLVYNFFVFLSLGDRNYLFYIIAILGNLMFFSSINGHVYRYLLSDYPMWAGNYIVNISMGVLGFGSALFSRSFLELKKYSRPLYYMHTVIMAASIFIIIATFFMRYHYVGTMAAVVLGVNAIVIFSSSIVSYRRGNSAARFFIMAWTFYLTGATLVILRNFGLLPGNDLVTHGVEIGAALEVILLSFALSDKYRIIKNQKEEAQRLALRLEKQTTADLEHKVKERTREIEKQKFNLEIEKKKSDDLLLNIMPSVVAEELKQHGSIKARLYINVTLLFIDVKNFTKIAEKLEPQALVDEIDYYFSNFDDIVSKYKLEKIKTIGDAYLAVGGMPDENHAGPNDVVMAALELQEFTNAVRGERKLGAEIRAGIHTGPVVAGVVGKSKYQFDIWGDAVNIAARMEQNSSVGRVNISHSTFDHIKSDFNCEYRGKINAKNKGQIDMYFVVGKKEA
ncbi:MAG: adenylate/guanylate cyclase domain-containing protein [Bacteroidia bacterium]